MMKIGEKLDDLEFSPFEDLSIGKVFEWAGVMMEVQEHNNCSGCYFNICRTHCSHFCCSCTERADNKDIIFKQIFVKNREIERKLTRSQIINLIKTKYKETGNLLYNELLEEIGE